MASKFDNDDGCTAMADFDRLVGDLPAGAGVANGCGSGSAAIRFARQSLSHHAAGHSHSDPSHDPRHHAALHEIGPTMAVQMKPNDGRHDGSRLARKERLRHDFR